MELADKIKLEKGSRLYDQTHEFYHYYDIEGAICLVDEMCTLEKVALLNRIHPAPGTFSRTQPVNNGERGLASLGYEGYTFDDLGPIIHKVSGDGLTVVNITTPGHRLHPGYVKRMVFMRGNSIYIRTIGEGVGAMPRANENLAETLWNGLVNAHIRYRINLQHRTR